MDSATPEPNVLLALASLNAGEHDSAFMQLQVYAERGDTLAQHTLAWCYQQGVGCAVDLPQAFHWWKLAAKAGFTEAQYATGRCLERGEGVERDLLAAASWYSLAADRHSSASEALVRVGGLVSESHAAGLMPNTSFERTRGK